MAPVKRKYRTIYLVTAALMVAMVGGYALAATSLSTGPGQASNLTSSPTSPFTTATITSEQLVVMTGTMVALGTAGSQTANTVGLAGTPNTLTACTVAPCTPVNLRPAVSPVVATTGDFSEQILLSVTQPTTASATASAFDFSITIVYELNGVPPTTTYSYQGYLGTGSTSAAASETIPVYLYIDLGTATPLTITTNGISAVFNTCSTTASCP